MSIYSKNIEGVIEGLAVNRASILEFGPRLLVLVLAAGILILSTATEAAVVALLPRSLKESKSCASVYQQPHANPKVFRDVLPTFEGNKELKETVESAEGLELTYKVYVEDEIFGADEIPSLRAQDQKMDPGTVMHVIQYNELTRRPIAAMRAVSSVKELGFFSVETQERTTSITVDPNQLPMYQDFPEIREEISQMGPAIELGRLGTLRNGPRLERALILTAHLLAHLPCCNKSGLSRSEMKAKFDTTVLAHANKEKNAVIYRALGMEEFARVTKGETTHVFFKQSARKMQDWLVTDFSRILSDESIPLFEQKLAAWKIRNEQLSGAQKRSPFPQIYLAELFAERGDFQRASIAYLQAAKLMRSDSDLTIRGIRAGCFNFSNSKEIASKPEVTKLLRLSAKQADAATDLFNKMAEFTESRIRSQPFSVEAEFALESGNVEWFAELGQRDFPPYQPLVESLAQAWLSEISKPLDQETIATYWYQAQRVQLDLPQLIYYPKFIAFKIIAARALGNSYWEQRYLRSYGFLREKNWYPEAGKNLPNL